MASQKPREIALGILRRHDRENAFVESLLADALRASPLSGADRSLVQELTYGVVRWRATLDWLIAQKTEQPPRQELLLWILRLGLYQLFWLDRVPDHAAVHESVELARNHGLDAKRGFINALLRNYVREQQATRQQLERLRHERPDLGFSHPQWLCDRWKARWGAAHLGKLLAWNNRPPKVYARRNALKATPQVLQEQWIREGVAFSPRPYDWTGADLVYAIEPGRDLTELDSFRQGLFYIQDPSTLLAVTMLHPQPGEAILDVCAAPGGKTTFMAQQMQNRGTLMAQDLDIHRRRAIQQNCDRLGVSIVTISRATTTINFDLSEPYDRVLLDAPCSNTGVLRRRVDLRWRLQPDTPATMAGRQLQLLGQSAQQVRPGGLLAYSTCSLEPEENEEVVARFLEQDPGLTLEKERHLHPWKDEVDGAYVALLRRPTPR